MKILFVASEAAPFAKTGGLADVCGALPRALADRGHDVRLVLPRYRVVSAEKYHLIPIMPELIVRWGQESLTGQVVRTKFPGSDMTVYFIDIPALFDREGIYNLNNRDYLDNDRRFAGFSIAALWMLKGLDWQPDVIHLNDWQTGLVPALLKHHPDVLADDFFKSMRTLVTIHNLAYQGNFPPPLVQEIGLPWSLYTSEGLEFYGRASMLKAALVYADAVSTVSPTYAREIQTETFGAGLDGLLRKRSGDLHGILNGIDTVAWDPTADPAIAAPIQAASGGGKAACKAALQERCGLPKKARVPLIGLVSRLTQQKGFDIVAGAIETLLAADLQIVLLGTGDERLERLFRSVADRSTKRFAAKIDYDEAFAHQVYAGSDMFLLPSAFEPCGLTQMYAMRYGSVPVVRRTGGLADTVIDASVPGIEKGESTGFVFGEYTAESLVAAVGRAVKLYRDDQPHWEKLRRNGMGRDFSWSRSAAEYESLYRTIAEAPRT